MISINIKAEQLKTIAPAFNSLRKTLAQSLSKESLRKSKMSFRFQRDFNTLKPWAPLSPSYKAWKEKKYPGKKILTLNDGLLNSLGIEKKSSFKYRVGTEKEFASKHEAGGLSRRKRGGASKIPARPFLFHKFSQDFLKKLFEEEVDKSLGGLL